MIPRHAFRMIVAVAVILLAGSIVGMYAHNAAYQVTTEDPSMYIQLPTK